MNKENIDAEILIRVQATPNPSAWKFVINRVVKTEGKASYSSQQDAQDLLLVKSLFSVLGVTQVHLFRNIVTVTHITGFEKVENWKESVSIVLQTRLPVHNPDFVIEQNGQKERREQIDPELKKIDDILDRTIRPGLQGDGGDIEVVELTNNRLIVRYEGACGSCPSATTGTLMAIEGILQDQYNSQIEVIPVP